MVHAVVGYNKLGESLEEIADELGVNLAAVYAALAHDRLNRDAIEADIVANAGYSLKCKTGA